MICCKATPHSIINLPTQLLMYSSTVLPYIVDHYHNKEKSHSNFFDFFQVITKFPKEKLSETEDALLLKHINNKKWKAAAKLIMKHEELLQELKVIILEATESECKTLCNPSQNFMLGVLTRRFEFFLIYQVGVRQPASLTRPLVCLFNHLKSLPSCHQCCCCNCIER